MSDARSFVQVISDIQKGQLVEQLSDELAAVVAAVMKHGRAGRLTLTLDVKRMSNAGSAVLVSPTVGSKIPEPPSPEAVFFGSPGGGLFRNDPNQQSLPLRAADDDERTETNGVAANG